MDDLKDEIKIHFDAQKPIPETSLFAPYVDFICACRKKYYYYRQKHKKAQRYMEADLDVLEIIRNIRELKVNTRSLFTVEQRKMSRYLAKREIDCDDTSSSSETPNDESDSQKFNFLSSIVGDINNNERNRRFLYMYMKIRDANDARKRKERKENEKKKKKVKTQEPVKNIVRKSLERLESLKQQNQL